MEYIPISFGGLLTAALLLFLPTAVLAEEEEALPPPHLGEHTETPYRPYSHRPAGLYGPMDTEFEEYWDPFWYEDFAGSRRDMRGRAIEPYWRLTNRIRFDAPLKSGSLFYQNAMRRSAQSFGTAPRHTYSNFRYRFNSPLRSIR